MSETNNERRTLTAIVKASSYEEPKAGGKCISVTFKFKGDRPEGFNNPTFKALANIDTWSVADFEDDSKEMEVTWEVQPPAPGKEANGNTYWLMKWNGKEKAPYVSNNKNKGGGGGYVKTAEEIHSASVCGIIKTSAEVTKAIIEDPKDYEEKFEIVSSAAIEKYLTAMTVIRQRAAQARKEETEKAA